MRHEAPPKCAAPRSAGSLRLNTEPVCEKVLEGGTVEAAVCPSFTQQLGKLWGDAFLKAPRGVSPPPPRVNKVV